MEELVVDPTDVGMGSTREEAIQECIAKGWIKTNSTFCAWWSEAQRKVTLQRQRKRMHSVKSSRHPVSLEMTLMRSRAEARPIARSRTLAKSIYRRKTVQ